MQHVLTEMQNHPSAWPFVQPVNRDEVTDYYEVITEPMDLSRMEFKLENNMYKSLEEFVHDGTMIFKNCRRYNSEGTTYVKHGNKVCRFLIALLT